jgi:hypothetical protein
MGEYRSDDKGDQAAREPGAAQRRRAVSGFYWFMVSTGSWSRRKVNAETAGIGIVKLTGEPGEQYNPFYSGAIGPGSEPQAPHVG